MLVVQYSSVCEKIKWYKVHIKWNEDFFTSQILITDALEGLIVAVELYCLYSMPTLRLYDHVTLLEKDFFYSSSERSRVRPGAVCNLNQADGSLN